jgi:aminoglycoside phosphotransferase (APT) family kinase protein
MKMHEGEVAINEELVEQLLAAQFPELADQPISAVQSIGTVNAIYRLGDDLCVRLPRMQAWAWDLDKELNWLPKLATYPRAGCQGPPSAWILLCLGDLPLDQRLSLRR